MTDTIRLKGGGPLRGTLTVPGDKSISHRALIFNAMAEGDSSVDGLLEAEDVESTIRCLRALGVSIESGHIVGSGGTFVAPSEDLFCGNSGTTIRLLMGALSGQAFRCRLTGDPSLSARPMARVSVPLSQMGAGFEGSSTHPPVVLTGGPLRNISYRSPVASAQVKTALMLASIQANGTLRYQEPMCSRDHTERMFRAMGIRFQDTVLDNGVHQIEISGPQTLQAQSLQVPGDISSAAFFMVGATIVPGSDVLIKNVGLNPTRSGVLDVLLRMGADIQVVAESFASGEPVGDLRVRSAKLTGTIIGGAEIPRMVDELPIIAVAAAEAHGETLVRDAKELRVKESDRIEATVRILTGMGVDAVPTDDGFVVQGSPQGPRSSFEVWAEGDHRIAMTASIGALQCQGTTTVHGSSSMQTSFPGFMETLERLRA